MSVNTKSINWNTVATVVSSLAAVVACFYASRSVEVSSQQLSHQIAEQATSRRHELEMQEATDKPHLSFGRVSNTMAIAQNSQGRIDFVRDEYGYAQPDRSHPIVWNLGAGPAINCKVRFSISSVDGKQLTPVEVCEITASPKDVPANGQSQFYLIPPCIENDKARKIKVAKGVATATCESRGGRRYAFQQDFQLITEYDKSPMRVSFIAEVPRRMAIVDGL